MRKSTAIVAFALILFSGSCLYSQELGYAFRAGLNISTLMGDLESDAAGVELEELSTNGGFHIGAGVYYLFNDRFGIRGEALYSQKGYRISYEGPSYLRLPLKDSDDALISFGDRRQFLDVTNSYIDVPLTGFVRLGALEFSAGVNVGFLVSSSASGEAIYRNGMVGGTNIPDPIILTLEYNFFNNSANTDDDNIKRIEFNVGGDQVSLPEQLVSYDSEAKSELHKSIDVGVLTGISYFLNDALFIGVRANLGLVDITENDNDRSIYQLDEDDEYLYLDHDDRNLTFQATIGFSF